MGPRGQERHRVWRCPGPYVLGWLVALLACAVFSVRVEAAIIVAPADVIEDSRDFLNGRPAEEIAQFGGPGSRRDVVELILTQKALRLGGYHGEMTLVAVNSYARALAELRAGRATLTGTTAWESDLRGENVYLSAPLIKDGQFEALLFTAPSNALALASRTRAQISHLSAVSNSAWTPDWKVLADLDLARVEDVPVWPTMVRLVAARHVDFLLAPTQRTSDGSLMYEEIRLVPIPDIKVVLPGSRHLGISRLAPESVEVRAALATGLAILDQRGELARAYQAAGFFDPSLKLRTLLNPQACASRKLPCAAP